MEEGLGEGEGGEGMGAGAGEVRVGVSVNVSVDVFARDSILIDLAHECLSPLTSMILLHPSSTSPLVSCAGVLRYHSHHLGAFCSPELHYRTRCHHRGVLAMAHLRRTATSATVTSCAVPSTQPASTPTAPAAQPLPATLATAPSPSRSAPAFTLTTCTAGNPCQLHDHIQRRQHTGPMQLCCVSGGQGLGPVSGITLKAYSGRQACAYVLLCVKAVARKDRKEESASSASCMIASHGRLQLQSVA